MPALGERMPFVDWFNNLDVNELHSGSAVHLVSRICNSEAAAKSRHPCRFIARRRRASPTLTIAAQPLARCSTAQEAGSRGYREPCDESAQ